MDSLEDKSDQISLIEKNLKQKWISLNENRAEEYCISHRDKQLSQANLIPEKSREKPRPK